MKSAQLTAEWEKQLDEVSKGELSEQTFMSRIESFVTTFVTANKNVGKKGAFSSDRAAIGYCPRCGKTVVEQKKSYSCESGKDGCGFVIWRVMCEKEITQAQAKKLLTKGKSDVIKGFISKAGKRFDAELVLDTAKLVKFNFC